MPRFLSAAVALAALATIGTSAGHAETSGRLVVPGPDADWVRVNETDTARAFVDRRSIAVRGGILRFVGAILNGQPDEDGVVQIVHRDEIDCGRRTYRVLAFDVFGLGGELLGSHSQDQGWTPINANSPNDALHREHCR